MTKEIEQLQKIVEDESRPAEERKAAAEHILKLQGEAASEINKSETQNNWKGFSRVIMDETASEEQRLRAAREAISAGVLPLMPAYFPTNIGPERVLYYSQQPHFRAYWNEVKDAPPQSPMTITELHAALDRILNGISASVKHL